MADILVVDDSPTMQNLVRTAIEAKGHKAHMAGDGVEGLEVLKGIDAPLAIVDINMPRLDGYSLVKSVRKDAKTSDMRIIFLTTETSDEAKAKMREVGANAWIGKPFDEDVLLNTVEQLLAS